MTENETPEYIPVIDFSTVDPGCSADVFEETVYQELGKVRENDLQTVVDAAVKDFDKIDPNNLFGQNPEKLELLIAFLRSKVMMKMCYGLAANWPATVPLITPEIKSVFYVFIRLLNQVKQPQLFLYWITHGLFPKIWTRKNFVQNSCIAAISYCSKVKTKK